MSKDFGEYRCFHMCEGRLEYVAPKARRQTAWGTAAAFWATHGPALERDFAQDAIKCGFVKLLRGLHEALAGGAGDAVLLDRVSLVLSQQRAFMVQFETCLDEFNAYLNALRLIDTCLRHGI
jgi:hypothetical protein